MALERTEYIVERTPKRKLDSKGGHILERQLHKESVDSAKQRKLNPFLKEIIAQNNSLSSFTYADIKK